MASQITWVKFFGIYFCLNLFIKHSSCKPHTFWLWFGDPHSLVIFNLHMTWTSYKLSFNKENIRYLIFWQAFKNNYKILITELSKCSNSEPDQRRQYLFSFVFLCRLHPFSPRLLRVLRPIAVLTLRLALLSLSAYWRETNKFYIYCM